MQSRSQHAKHPRNHEPLRTQVQVCPNPSAISPRQDFQLQLLPKVFQFQMDGGGGGGGGGVTNLPDAKSSDKVLLGFDKVRISIASSVDDEEAPPRCSFSGASHPPEPVDEMDTVFVAVDGRDKPVIVWDASPPPSGAASPHSSIDSSGAAATVTSIAPSCTVTSHSAKTSVSSSAASDGSGWSNSTAGGAGGNGRKPHKGGEPRWKAILGARALDGPLGMGNFRLLRRLGCGDIGTVYLSELSNAGGAAGAARAWFAMKVMDKASLESRRKLSRAQTEREILQLLDHPFLPTLYAHFETDRFACLVMEFCPGGDLHVARQRQPGRRFSLSSTRFYVAETVLALEYLHMMGVVYRDLKPENVLVRGDGHIMLSDFDLSLKCDVVPKLLRRSNLPRNNAGRGDTGAEPSYAPSCVPPIQPVLSCFFNGVNKCHAKEGPPKPGAAASDADESEPKPDPELVVEPVAARSKSFVGTHEYLAPEVISGQGHGSAVDWWTLGVFMYEMMYGRTPFKGENNQKTLINIIKQPLSFPRIATSSAREWDELLRAQELMSQLLAKNPKKRLGSSMGSAEVKRHDFFKGVNWALVRAVRPPEVPQPPAPAQKKVLVMSKKERQEPYNYRPDDRFEYF